VQEELSAGSCMLIAICGRTNISRHASLTAIRWFCPTWADVNWLKSGCWLSYFARNQVITRTWCATHAVLMSSNGSCQHGAKLYWLHFINSCPLPPLAQVVVAKNPTAFQEEVAAQAEADVR
jgi:hypothetical protein